MVVKYISPNYKYVNDSNPKTIGGWMDGFSSKWRTLSKLGLNDLPLYGFRVQSKNDGNTVSINKSAILYPSLLKYRMTNNVVIIDTWHDKTQFYNPYLTITDTMEECLEEFHSELNTIRLEIESFAAERLDRHDKVVTQIVSKLYKMN